MNVLDGQGIAEKKLKKIRQDIVKNIAEPTLAVILVGHDPASDLYVTLKEKAAKKVGIDVRRYLFDADVSQDDMKTCIDFLNTDEDTHGIIVQLPLPKNLDADVIVNMIDPDKDVDGFHKDNQEKFLADKEGVHPVFPAAIMALIKDAQINLSEKNTVVVGKSDVFDRVMTHALERKGARAQFIQITNEQKKLSAEQQEVIKGADVVVSALGRAHFFSGENFKNDAIVIDGGITRIEGETVGDVNQKSCVETDIALSPVPNGVGPVTIAYLLNNVLFLSQKNQ